MEVLRWAMFSSFSLAVLPGGGGGGGGGGGALPLWESVGMRRGFAPHFRHLDDLFAPQNLTFSTILFRSCWVPFRSPPFSACRRSFCPQNWPNLSFYSDLVGSHFELRAVHPYWFWPGVPPPPPPGQSSVWVHQISPVLRRPKTDHSTSFHTISSCVLCHHSLAGHYKVAALLCKTFPSVPIQEAMAGSSICILY